MYIVGHIVANPEAKPVSIRPVYRPGKVGQKAIRSHPIRNGILRSCSPCFLPKRSMIGPARRQPTGVVIADRLAETLKFSINILNVQF